MAFKLLSAQRSILLASGLGFLLVAALLGWIFLMGQNAREQAAVNLEQSFRAPEIAVKTQVKRIKYQTTDENGNTVFIEILFTGHVTMYDEAGNVLKRGLQGFGRIDQLLRSMLKYLPSFSLTPFEGSIALEIETSDGIIIVYIDPDGDNGILDEIIDEIEGIGNDTFAPTPTPLPPSPTITYPSPTPLPPTPTSVLMPGISPTAGPSPTPTPLPDYMLAPPFSCSEVVGNKRIRISDVLCEP